jgi:hypothetical protein
MYIGAREVKPLPDFRLLITFENGEQKVFDVTPYLDLGAFRELKDRELFNTARISFDTVEWPNGADLCPEILYEQSVPQRS